MYFLQDPAGTSSGIQKSASEADWLLPIGLNEILLLVDMDKEG
jgi:hypothetical protein